MCRLPINRPRPFQNPSVRSFLPLVFLFAHSSRFVDRDPWTGFPILARPSGPVPLIFLQEHVKTMYPSDLEGHGHAITVSETYRPLVLHWALNTLSALKFVHSH